MTTNANDVDQVPSPDNPESQTRGRATTNKIAPLYNYCYNVLAQLTAFAIRPKRLNINRLEFFRPHDEHIDCLRQMLRR